MASRRAGRRQAIDVLYQADVTGRDPRVVLAGWAAAGKELHPFAEELGEGVTASRTLVDETIAKHAEHWSLERMAAVDRTILRLACFELIAGSPPGPVISEAVKAAKELSTEDSGRFVNGVLGTIARERDADEPHRT